MHAQCTHGHRQREFFDSLILLLIKTHPRHVPTLSKAPSFHLDPSHKKKPKHFKIQKQIKMEDQSKNWKWKNFGNLPIRLVHPLKDGFMACSLLEETILAMWLHPNVWGWRLLQKSRGFLGFGLGSHWREWKSLGEKERDGEGWENEEEVESFVERDRSWRVREKMKSWWWWRGMRRKRNGG